MSEARPTISTHVLDTGTGRPAEGVLVVLYRLDLGDEPARLTQALTDGDGRVRDLLGRPLAAGEYRLEFRVGGAEPTFFRRLVVDFRVTDTSRGYHIPLLVAPYALATYRGS
ncbi:MAG TPA: hydroxyisourate hydrolase [Candidatus Limnocylindrales bacterium]|nr:hydroxyisourate hydrolase [Candidatus Limnocylindrales bacterium]